jgi:aspartate 1-decarboxylase
MCKSKIHGAIITDANLRYEGSISIDAALLEAAHIVPYERVQVVNLNNGARLETYCLIGEPGSGTMCLNGAAARHAAVGDEILIISYAIMTEAEIAAHQPTVVFLDGNNHIRNITRYDQQSSHSRAAQLS